MGETLEAIRHHQISSELWGIASSLQRLREEHWLAAQEIVASVALVENSVERLRQSVERQGEAVRDGLRSVEMKLNRLSLQNDRLLDVLAYERETRSLAARKNGEKAMLLAFYDDALIDLGEALRDNRYDFIALYYCAVIHFEFKDDTAEAWLNAEAAAKYSRMWRGDTDDPTPTYFESRAILLLGRILYEHGDYEGALEYFILACQRSPDYVECFVRCGRAALKLQNRALAIDCIRRIILLDEGESVRLLTDPDYEVIREDIKASLKARASVLAKIALRARTSAKRWIAALKDVDSELGAEALPDDHVVALVNSRPPTHLLDLTLDIMELQTAVSHEMWLSHAQALAAIDVTQEEDEQIIEVEVERAEESAASIRLAAANSAERHTEHLGCMVALLALAVIMILGPGSIHWAYTQGGGIYYGVPVLVFALPLIIFGIKKYQASMALSSGEHRATRMLTTATQDIQRTAQNMESQLSQMRHEIVRYREEFNRSLKDATPLRASLILMHVPNDCDMDALYGDIAAMEPGRSSTTSQALASRFPSVLAKDQPPHLLEGWAYHLRMLYRVEVGVRRYVDAPFPNLQ
jgi:tetratricopeptide (TPR) repeat protein